MMKRKIWYPWGLCWITVVLIGLLSGACGKGEQGASSLPIAVTPAGEWRTWNFDQVPAGQLPSGFSVQKIGSGTLPKWEVLADSTAPSPPNALAQRSKENSGEHFNVTVVEDSDYQDLELEVKFKAVEGTEDQGGGLILSCTR